MAPIRFDGPCIICGTYESSEGRFIKKMCKKCYRRISFGSGNVEPIQKYAGPCVVCGTYESSSNRFVKKMCNRCYQGTLDKAERKRDPKYMGPCTVCDTYDNGNYSFTNKMCKRCYNRIHRGGNYTPRTTYIGPCERCDSSDPDVKYTRKMCPKCYKWFCRKTFAYQSKRRAKVREVENTLTPEQWKRVLEYYDYHCAYCNKDIRDSYTMDHVIPLAKNGANAIHNIVPSCLSCNCRKGTGNPLSPVVTLST